MYRNIVMLAAAVLCAVSLGCGHGLGPRERALDRLEGKMTYEEARYQWGPPLREYRNGDRVTATWGLGHRVELGSPCPGSPNCLGCQVVWRNYVFYFKGRDQVLDRWEATLPFFGRRQEGRVFLEPGQSAADCLADHACRWRALDQCQDLIGPLPDDSVPRF